MSITFSSQVNKNYDNIQAKAKWQCPKCGVGLPYNTTHRIEGLCSTCRTYDDTDRLLGGSSTKEKYKIDTHSFAIRLRGKGSIAVNFYDNCLDRLDM